MRNATMLPVVAPSLYRFTLRAKTRRVKEKKYDKEDDHFLSTQLRTVTASRKRKQKKPQPSETT